MIIFPNVLKSQGLDKKILVCYGDLYPDKVKGYDYLILEPAYFSSSDVTMMKQNNKKILAYISLGEVDKTAWYYPQLKPHVLGENKIWDSKILNLSNTTTKIVLLSLVKDYITVKGFDGLFIDNIDNYTIYGPTPIQKPSLLNFLKEVKIKFPNIHIMQNAGIEIVDDTINYINTIAVESVVTDYDFSNNRYRLRDNQSYYKRLKQLSGLKKKHNISIILIEYADDKYLYKQVLKKIKKIGWSYFIGQIDLQQIPKL